MADQAYIISEGIIMRPFQDVDAEKVFMAIDTNRSILKRWLGWVDNIKTIEDSKKTVAQSINDFADGKSFRFGIFVENKYAGIVDLKDVNQKDKRASVGYWLGQEYQGKGIMTSALKQLLEFGFGTLDLNRIEIHVAPNNLKSRALPEKLGFKQEGQLRQFEWLYDHFEDHLVFSLLKIEWEK